MTDLKTALTQVVRFFPEAVFQTLLKEMEDAEARRRQAEQDARRQWFERDPALLKQVIHQLDAAFGTDGRRAVLEKTNPANNLKMLSIRVRPAHGRALDINAEFPKNYPDAPPEFSLRAGALKNALHDLFPHGIITLDQNALKLWRNAGDMVELVRAVIRIMDNAKVAARLEQLEQI